MYNPTASTPPIEVWWDDTPLALGRSFQYSNKYSRKTPPTKKEGIP